MAAYLNLTGVVDNSTKTVYMDVEGTLDYFHVADAGSGVNPKQIDNGSNRIRRGAGGILWRGFEFRTTNALNSLVQTVQRTLAVSNIATITGNFGTWSSTSKSGYFTFSGTSQLGMGYRMVLEAPAWRRLRLRCYDTNWRCTMTGTAMLLDGSTQEVPQQQVVLAGVNGNNLPEWQIDFQGGTNRSVMIFEAVCTAQLFAQDQNYGVQGFTLQVI